jgi:hypothetical protein
VIHQVVKHATSCTWKFICFRPPYLLEIVLDPLSFFIPFLEMMVKFILSSYRMQSWKLFIVVDFSLVNNRLLNIVRQVLDLFYFLIGLIFEIRLLTSRLFIFFTLFILGYIITLWFLIFLNYTLSVNLSLLYTFLCFDLIVKFSNLFFHLKSPCGTAFIFCAPSKLTTEWSQWKQAEKQGENYSFKPPRISAGPPTLLDSYAHLKFILGRSVHSTWLYRLDE